MCIQGFDAETWGEKRTLGRPRRRWEGNIKLGLQEEGQGRTDWNDEDHESCGGHL